MGDMNKMSFYTKLANASSTKDKVWNYDTVKRGLITSLGKGKRLNITRSDEGTFLGF